MPIQDANLRQQRLDHDSPTAVNAASKSNQKTRSQQQSVSHTPAETLTNTRPTYSVTTHFRDHRTSPCVSHVQINRDFCASHHHFKLKDAFMAKTVQEKRRTEFNVLENVSYKSSRGIDRAREKVRFYCNLAFVRFPEFRNGFRRFCFDLCVFAVSKRDIILSTVTKTGTISISTCMG